MSSSHRCEHDHVTAGSFSSAEGKDIIQATNDPDDLSQQYPLACGLVGTTQLVLQQLTRR